VTDSKLGYLANCTNGIQTQLNSKANPATTYTHTERGTDSLMPLLNRAFTLGSGLGYYYNLPVSANGIFIWDGATTKVQFKPDLTSCFSLTWKQQANILDAIL